MESLEIQILLVEDNMNDAELTIRALSRNNITNKVIHLKNGAIAIDFLFGKGEFKDRDVIQKPKVILLDLKMPKMDGIEVLAVIKADELTKNIPVVMLTSSREHPDIERAYSLGANSYIVKPVEFDSFSKAIAELGFYWLLLNHPPIK